MSQDSFDVLSDLPAEIGAAIKTYGLAKVASELLGAPTITESDVYSAIGTALFMRRKEAAAIQQGLASLHALQEDK